MNEIAKTIGESLQGMKGPEVLLVIASVLSIPVFLYILVMEAVNEVKKRRMSRMKIELQRGLDGIIMPFLETEEAIHTLWDMEEDEVQDFANHIEGYVAMGELPLDVVDSYPQLIAEAFGEYTGCEIN